MASLYLVDELEPSDVVVGHEIRVTGSEARHAVTVNRTRVGESLLLGNGHGLIVRGVVTAADSTELLVRTKSVEHEGAPRPPIVLVQALAKGDRDELAIQAATELGVDRVVPWSSERSVSRWSGPKVQKGIDRWRSIVREASKQSIRAWVPTVGELVTRDAVAALCASSRAFVLEPASNSRLTAVRFDDDDRRDIVLIIGPEGGISPDELAVFAGAGAEQVRLGTTVLRTSTAGPAALSVLNATLGRW